MPVTPDPTVSMVRFATSWCLASVPCIALLAGLWHGWSGAWGAAVGALVVTAFFALGVLAVNLVVAAAPGLSVVAAFGVYATQLMILLLVVAIFRDYGDIDRPAFAFGAVAGTMIWQVAHTRAFVRQRTPLYRLTAPKEEP